MNRIIAILLAALGCNALLAQSTDSLAASYLSSYSEIAVKEMFRSGVPASITLAQGMLESAFGRSPLAVKANNHFGIKCHKGWNGDSMSYDDDRKGECFRKYSTAEESFTDHSDFLRYRERYAFLFDYSITDYKSWAYGLKKAGYATSPEYASRLVDLIERYRLFRFDNIASAAASNPDDASSMEQLSSKMMALISAEGGNVLPATPHSLSRPNRYKGKGIGGTYAVSLSREVLQINGVPFVYVRQGETYALIANQYGLFRNEILRYNDDRGADPDQVLTPGIPVYLAPKAGKAASGLEKHICAEGETLVGISQKYAVRLRSLCRINGFKRSDVPLSEDQTILLRPVGRK